MIQNIIAYIIIALAFLHVSYGFYKTFLVKNKKSGCNGCSANCQLKKKMMKNVSVHL